MRSTRLICLLSTLMLPMITVANQQKGATPPLHDAVIEGDLDKVKELVENDHNIDARDEHGRTALYHAVVNGHLEVVKFLISKDADVNIKDNYGVAPLACLVSLLFMEPKREDVEVLKLLIAHDANVREKDESDWTALHWAANAGQKDIAVLLIAKGADINAKDVDGQTPLHMASSKGNVDLAALLIAKGADIDIRDRDSRTPLNEAAIFGHKNVVMLLVTKGADITTKGMYGHTPLHDAAWFGHTNIVAFLLDKGADIHSLGKSNETPLHLAAEGGEKETVELLIAKGAYVDAKNRYGATPLGLAVGERRRITELPKAKDPNSYCERGCYFYRRNEFDRSIEDYTTSIRLKPDNEYAYYWRGRVWATKGNPQKAIDDWKKAIELDWHNALHIHYSRRLLTAAHPELDRIIKNTSIKHLNEVKEVSGYAVGFGGSPGDFYTVSLIISEPFDEEIFLQMAKNKNPVIRAMGMICLAREDMSRYEKAIHSFYTDKSEVNYVPIGCGVGRISLAELARNIIEDPNLIDYWSPSHIEWMSNTSRDSKLEDWIQYRIEVIQLLLTKGADINVKDQYGDIPLHYAAQHGNSNISKLLIAKGATVNEKNNNSETPLHYATLWGNSKVVELLLENGAAAHEKTSRGQNALQIAIQMNYQGLANLLRRYETKQ